MKKLFGVLFLFFSAFVFGQRFELLEGNLKNLKGINEYNITFDYSDIKVHGYETEEDFLKEKMDKRKDVEGKSEQFKRDWFDDRQNKYEPRFISYFNKRFDKGEIKAVKNQDVKYSMNVSTVWVYPGYFMEPSKISAIVKVFETANPKNILVAIKFDKAIGFEENQFNGNRGDRMAGAYEKIAKNMVMQLKRFL